MRTWKGWILLVLALSLFGCSRPAGSPRASIGFERVADRLDRPLFVTHAGDGSGRLFLLEQPGRIRVVQDGKLLPEPFLDITAQVLSTGYEQGLLGLAFHPEYRQNGRFFVHYTGLKGETVLARYRVSATDPNRADPEAFEVLLTTEPHPFANHNGGATLFGPDGYLYTTIGDGGFQTSAVGDPYNHGQNLRSLLGKILRIDVAADHGYAIPPTNPFVGDDARPEIWAYGLRNPWRISFDRATGDLYIADAGHERMEEINFQPADSPGGENYGWRVYEGSLKYGEGDLPGATFPVATYRHGPECVVVGGYAYRGERIASLTGSYLYGDNCSGRVWALRRTGDKWVSTELTKTSFRITSFGEDEAGELYLLDREGVVYRIVPAGRS